MKLVTRLKEMSGTFDSWGSCHIYPDSLHLQPVWSNISRGSQGTWLIRHTLNLFLQCLRL
nr:hypothetical protein Iba_chr14cCG13090 [Ipomoea batatas]